MEVKQNDNEDCTNKGYACDGQAEYGKVEVCGTTRVCGLIGNPVEHTLSPLIHNTLATRKGLDMVYVPFLVQNDQVEDAVKGAFSLNVLGLNVTVPHKSAVISNLVDIDPLAKNIGAVNTLVRQADGYKGYNTDMTGLKRAMASDGIQIQSNDVIILGAGGAARAVAFLCATEQAASITILNRTLDKAEAIATEVNRVFRKGTVCAGKLNEYSSLPNKKYLVIQSTSVGLHPHNDEAVIMDPDFYNMVENGFDLIYKPEETMFMKLVKKAGGNSFNGLKMLLYQGIDAFELWNQIKIDDEDAMAVYQILKESIKV